MGLTEQRRLAGIEPQYEDWRFDRRLPTGGSDGYDRFVASHPYRISENEQALHFNAKEQRWMPLGRAEAEAHHWATQSTDLAAHPPAQVANKTAWLHKHAARYHEKAHKALKDAGFNDLAAHHDQHVAYHRHHAAHPPEPAAAPGHAAAPEPPPGATMAPPKGQHYNSQHGQHMALSPDLKQKRKLALQSSKDAKQASEIGHEHAGFHHEIAAKHHATLANELHHAGFDPLADKHAERARQHYSASQQLAKKSA